MNAQYTSLPAALIFNPASGAADDGRKFHDTLQELLGGVNIEVTSFEAKDDGELAEATAKARQLGTDLVIVCGGDGTVEAVANGLVGSGITLGILPAGTRNNLAASLNIRPTSRRQRRSCAAAHCRRSTPYMQPAGATSAGFWSCSRQGCSPMCLKMPRRCKRATWERWATWPPNSSAHRRRLCTWPWPTMRANTWQSRQRRTPYWP